MSDFPKKIFEMPFQNDPRPDIYKQLTDKNAEYPVTGLNNSVTYLPDFTRAIELGSFIYRINVPGYLYKCPGGSSMNSSGKSGIVIDRYACFMDNYGHHPHRYSIIGSDTSISGDNDSYDGLGSHECYVIPDWYLYLGFEKDNNYTGSYGASFYVGSTLYGRNGKGIYKPSDFSKFAPSKIVGGVSAQVAVRANMRSCPENGKDGKTFTRSLALNYIVNTGTNSAGGVMNCMAPIIPGVKTTSNATGTYQGSDGYNMSWSIPALGEVFPANVTDICYIKDTKKYYCMEAELRVDGVLEARGTYIYPYRGSGNTDKFLFVPAKAVGNDVKPVTKIRSTTATACTYNIPASNREEAWPKTSCSIHIQENTATPVWGVEDGNASGATFSGTCGTKTVNDTTSLICGPTMVAHSSAFDAYFIEIFANPSLTGHKTKFVAQQMNLQAFPGNANANGTVNITDSVTAKVFDPTTDGA